MPILYYSGRLLDLYGINDNIFRENIQSYTQNTETEDTRRNIGKDCILRKMFNCLL